MTRSYLARLAQRANAGPVARRVPGLGWEALQEVEAAPSLAMGAEASAPRHESVSPAVPREPLQQPAQVGMPPVQGHRDAQAAPAEPSVHAPPWAPPAALPPLAHPAARTEPSPPVAERPAPRARPELEPSRAVVPMTDDDTRRADPTAAGPIATEPMAAQSLDTAAPRHAPPAVPARTSPPPLADRPVPAEPRPLPPSARPARPESAAPRIDVHIGTVTLAVRAAAPAPAPRPAPSPARPEPAPAFSLHRHYLRG